MAKLPTKPAVGANNSSSTNTSTSGEKAFQEAVLSLLRKIAENTGKLNGGF